MADEFVAALIDGKVPPPSDTYQKGERVWWVRGGGYGTCKATVEGQSEPGGLVRIWVRSPDDINKKVIRHARVDQLRRVEP